jgi:hypothetical protein
MQQSRKYRCRNSKCNGYIQQRFAYCGQCKIPTCCIKNCTNECNNFLNDKTKCHKYCKNHFPHTCSFKNCTYIVYDHVRYSNVLCPKHNCKFKNCCEMVYDSEGNCLQHSNIYCGFKGTCTRKKPCAHGCKYAGCHNYVVTNGLTVRNYCFDHLCKYKKTCANSKHKDDIFCKAHTCGIIGCTKWAIDMYSYYGYKNFCRDHKCSYSMCPYPTEQNNDRCESHKHYCRYVGKNKLTCNKLISTKSFKFCDFHKCTNDESCSGTKHCYIHMCYKCGAKKDSCFQYCDKCICSNNVLKNCGGKGPGVCGECAKEGSDIEIII